MSPVFKRVLVANRGEIALRIIRACQKLGIETVAVYSETDADSPHLDYADQRVCVGRGHSASSYLNQTAILEAARAFECQALHPGYGYLSENARFASRCLQQKTTFIGPSPSMLRLMGDKITAIRTMEQHGVVGVPGSRGLVSDVSAALTIAARVGYPVLLKATAGGGGKGMRVCRDARELPEAFAEARLEAEAAFGEAGLFIERFIEDGRHIEFQVLGDHYGHVIHLGERECSTQRSNQKLVEESPSPCVSSELRAEVGERLAAVMSRLGYVGLGTVEFLRAPSGALYFLEMNTRLQVEHPVTELVTGEDLVAWQIRIAAGQRLALRQEDVALRGHAIECRINAEDPDDGFRPSPGTLTHFEAPVEWSYNLEGPVRLDTHVVSGYRIPATADSMIAKLVVWAEHRPASIARMRAALDALVIRGVATTLRLSSAIMEDAHFVSGDYTTAEMSEMMVQRASDKATVGSRATLK